LFLLHAFAIFHFGERRDFEPPSREPRGFLFVAKESPIETQLAELMAYRDPTLFALPHPHGFSGGAWQLFDPEVPKLTNWTAPPEWLELPDDQSGRSLNDYLATNRPSAEPLLAALRMTRRSEPRIPSEPVLTNTIVRVEGSLAGRALVKVPPVPKVVHPDVLKAPTVVAVSVNGDGVVETASIAGSSGLRTADEQAVKAARRFEFQPVAIRHVRDRESAAPVSGQLIFIWQVVAESGTAATTR
jgi:TonB family protein